MIKTATALMALVVATVAVNGCASVPLATPDQDLRARSAQPLPGTALVYIYRNESFGSAVRMGVLVDGVYLGDSAAKTYLITQVSAGPHTIVSKAENDATLPILAQPGQRYFVWQEVKMGAFSARSELHLMSDAEGSTGMGECKLIQMAPPPGPPPGFTPPPPQPAPVAAAVPPPAPAPPPAAPPAP